MNDNYYIKKEIEYGDHETKAQKLERWLWHNKNFEVAYLEEFNLPKEVSAKPNKVFARIIQKNNNTNDWDLIRRETGKEVLEWTREKLLEAKREHAGGKHYIDYYKSFAKVIPEMPPVSGLMKATEEREKEIINNFSPLKEMITVMNDESSQ